MYANDCLTDSLCAVSTNNFLIYCEVCYLQLKGLLSSYLSLLQKFRGMTQGREVEEERRKMGKREEGFSLIF